MKLSICIPVYNIDVCGLVSDLLYQIRENKINAEILLIDDASDLHFRKINETLTNKVYQIIFLEENIGRSKIRNKFLEIANGEYLLFLDCDVKIISQRFLVNYVDEIEHDKKLDVIYGGFQVDESNNNLRNIYSIKREISSEFESSNIDLLQTVNMVIKKTIFQHKNFDETLKQYGYEDFLFAQKLKEANVNFKYINNPVLHVDYSTNKEFLNKIDLAVENLFFLSRNSNQCKYLLNIKLFRTINTIQKLKLHKIFLFIYRIFKKSIIKNLLSNNPQMTFLDIYKIGKFLEIYNEKSQNYI